LFLIKNLEKNAKKMVNKEKMINIDSQWEEMKK